MPPSMTPSMPRVADFAQVRCSAYRFGGSGDNKAAGGTPRSGVLVEDVLGGKGCIQVTLSAHRSRRETRKRAWVRRIAAVVGY